MSSSRTPVSRANVPPYSALWSFLTSWRHLFDRFDIDHSGTISLSEFSSALTAFGYRLSPAYVGELFEAYDVRGRRVLSFDMFVQACISLKRMVCLCFNCSIKRSRPIVVVRTKQKQLTFFLPPCTDGRLQEIRRRSRRLHHIEFVSFGISFHPSSHLCFHLITLLPFSTTSLPLLPSVFFQHHLPITLAP